MLDRRQFIKRVTWSLLCYPLFGRPVVHSEPTEMPVTLGNRSVFYPLWGEQGIKTSDVRAQIEKLNKRPSLVFDPYAVVGDGWSLDNGQTAVENCAQFAQALAQQDPALNHLPLPDGANMRRMNRILAANPDMTREQAFFDAVMEGAEAAL